MSEWNLNEFATKSKENTYQQIIRNGTFGFCGLWLPKVTQNPFKQNSGSCGQHILKAPFVLSGGLF